MDALAWQVQRRIIEANLQASKTNPTDLILREKGLRRVQFKTVLRALFEQTTQQLAFRRSRQRWECHICEQSMGDTSLVRRLRAGPRSGEIQTVQSTGNSLGTAVRQVDIHSNWVGSRISLAFSGPISRCYVVLELCGMDFSISVKI